MEDNGRVSTNNSGNIEIEAERGGPPIFPADFVDGFGTLRVFQRNTPLADGLLLAEKAGKRTFTTSLAGRVLTGGRPQGRI
jgi:hypothetical protein